MRKQIGLLLVCAGLILAVAVFIGQIYHSLPFALAIALIVLPSLVSAFAASLVWRMLIDHHARHIRLEEKMDALTERVDTRLTQLLVLAANEQRAAGVAEGLASAPPVDQLTITTAAAAAVASVVAAQTAANADAAVVAKKLIEDAALTAAEVERVRVASAAAAAKIAANVANGQTEARLNDIAANTAATVQAIRENHV